jgi:anaerobic selenocysteine-containing dehydrogenase
MNASMSAGRSTRLIVIDPRHVGLANKADLWLRVRPGTDAAPALGIANLMIERGWYDRDFIRDWSNGPLLVRADTGRLLTEHDLAPVDNSHRVFAWDSSAARLVPYDTATGRYDGSNLALQGEYRVVAAQGEVVCHPGLIWHSRPVSYYAWSGHEQHANVTQTARAMSLLYSLTGSFDQPGGNVLLAALPAAPITGDDLPSVKAMGPTLGLFERPLGPARWGYDTTSDLYRALREGEPHPVHAVIGFGRICCWPTPTEPADARRSRNWNFMPTSICS